MFLLKSSRKWVPVNMIFLLNGTKNQKFGKFFPIMSPLRHKIQNSFSILERTLRIIYDLWAPVMWPCYALSGHVPEIQAEVEVVKIKNPDFSCWAWSTPWGLVLSLKSFCRNPVLSWAIRYSVFQKVKFT